MDNIGGFKAYFAGFWLPRFFLWHICIPRIFPNFEKKWPKFLKNLFILHAKLSIFDWIIKNSLKKFARFARKRVLKNLLQVWRSPTKIPDFKPKFLAKIWHTSIPKWDFIDENRHTGIPKTKIRTLAYQFLVKFCFSKPPMVSKSW